MHALDTLGDSVRQRILELVRDGEAPAGALVATSTDEFGISQPALAQHLRVLRERDFVTVRPEGNRRLAAAMPAGHAPASAVGEPTPTPASAPTHLQHTKEQPPWLMYPSKSAP